MLAAHYSQNLAAVTPQPLGPEDRGSKLVHTEVVRWKIRRREHQVTRRVSDRLFPEKPLR